MLRTLFTVLFILICPLAAYGQAPAAVSWYVSSTDGLKPVENFRLQLMPSGAEAWVVDAYSKHPSYDLISPKVFGRSGTAQGDIGLYVRLSGQMATRLGVEGAYQVGRPSGWQGAGLAYLFRAQVPGGLRGSGLALPNFRLTHSLGGAWRAGLGADYLAVERKPAAVILGPYLSFGQKDLTLQVRLGEQVEPTALRGRNNLFTAVTYRF